LESELRSILYQRDEVVQDQFDQLLQTAPIVDILGSVDMDEFFMSVAAHLSQEIPLEQEAIVRLLQQREQESSTVITPFVAIPHIIAEGQHQFRIFIARCKNGIQFSEKHQDVKAIFVILGTKDERNLHLKALAAIAQIIQEEEFEKKWLLAKNEHQLRDILLLSQRKRL
jgi:mannitol/fructose-specific phosphotransferase system IIA component (Ntr-type)